MIPHTPFRAMALLASSVVAAGALVACASAGERGDVLATTAPIAALAREVVRGTPLRVASIVPSGVDPHDYGPSPDDVKRVSVAKVVLRNGLGLDVFLDRAIENSGQRNVVTVTAGVQVREVVGEGGKREADPHVWHDVVNAKVMVDNIVNALGVAYPDFADTFRTNGAAYAAKLEDADAEVRRIIEAIPAAKRKIVTDHDAFGYFIERYGLTFVGAVIPSVSSQGDASAKEIARLQDTVGREGVRAIFSEQSVDPKVAREIAKDTGVRIVSDLHGDSLGRPGSGADTVDGMLLFNARKIAEALR